MPGSVPGEIGVVDRTCCDGKDEDQDGTLQKTENGKHDQLPSLSA
jgi:hypothetical protein